MTAKAVLAKATLRWSSPLLFNDPFDVPRTAELGFTPEALRDGIHQAFIGLIRQKGLPKNPTFALLLLVLKSREGPVSEEVTLASLREHLETLGPLVEASLNQFRQAWEEMVPRMRILCLSAVKDSLPMWAHYSERHKGVVLQFEISDERDSSLLLAQPVTYRPDRATLPGADVWAQAVLGQREIDWQEYFRDYYYLKSPDWSYEKEWRVVSFAHEGETGHSRDSPFDPRDLSAVFLGTDVAGGDQADILATVESRFPHALVYRAAVDYTTCQLGFTRLR